MIQCIGDSKGSREYREFAHRTISEALQEETEMLSKYDISSTFTNTIVETLQYFYKELKNNVLCKCQSPYEFPIKREGTVYQMLMTNITLSSQLPIAREEICTLTNNSQVISTVSGNFSF